MRSPDEGDGSFNGRHMAAMLPTERPIKGGVGNQPVIRHRRERGGRDWRSEPGRSQSGNGIRLVGGGTVRQITNRRQWDEETTVPARWAYPPGAPPTAARASGTVQIVWVPSWAGNGPPIAGSRTPGSTCTSKISST